MKDQKELIPSDMPSDEARRALKMLSPEIRAELIEQEYREMQAQRIVRLEAENETLRRDVDQFKAEQEFRNEEVADGLRQVADASARRMKNSDEYYVRTVLGKVFAPEISGKRMTKLLNVVGIVGLHSDPYAQYRSGVEPMAKPKPFSEYPTWLFHAKKVMTRIDVWLQENGWYEDFHNTTTKDERDAFIDMLYEEYGG